MLQSHIRSYVIAPCFITHLMVSMIGDVRRGPLSMVPNLIPVIGCLALMGWLGIRLDGSALLVGAIVFGLAVDDTIHFMNKFSSYYEDSGDSEAAILETLRTTGLRCSLHRSRSQSASRPSASHTWSTPRPSAC
jgi:predicted RND superfamily exporter protein